MSQISGSPVMCLCGLSSFSLARQHSLQTRYLSKVKAKQSMIIKVLAPNLDFTGYFVGVMGEQTYLVYLTTNTENIH